MFDKINAAIDWLKAKRVLLRKLAFVLVALIMLVIYGISWLKGKDDGPKELPAYVALKCSKCGRCEDRRIYTLQDDNPTCAECDGRLGYRMKCMDCEFEFAFFPGSYDTVGSIKGQNRTESVTTLLNQRMCPNCGGPKTFHVQPTKEGN